MTLVLKSLVSAGAALSLVLSVGACRSPLNGAADAWTAQSAHPITVDTHLISEEFHIAPDGTELRQDDKDRIAALAADYRGRGIGKLTVTAPQGSPNAAAAVQIAAEMTDIAQDQGVPPRAVDIAGYHATTAQADPPIIVTYTVYRAEASACGDWTRNYAFAPLNHVTPDHGCATQNNLAAEVENPRDLITARSEQPADQGRRKTVFDQYRQGETTSSKEDQQAKGTVSEVDKQ
jgi:pilus assembly protein CpaD